MKIPVYFAVSMFIVSMGISINAADHAPQISASRGQNALLSIESEEVTVNGIVEKIHKSKRFITIKTQDGNILALKVTLEADGLEKIYPGDRVSVNYLESVALILNKAEETASHYDGSPVVQLAAKGRPPAMTLVDTIELAGTVENIDRKDHLITVRGPSLDTVKLSVPADNPIFTRLKKGDQISTRYSENLALGVKKQKNSVDPTFAGG